MMKTNRLTILIPVFFILVSLPISLYAGYNLKFGIQNNYSLAINNYFREPKTGFSPSIGIYGLIIPQTSGFGLSASINYEWNEYIIRVNDDTWSNIHFNYRYQDIVFDANALHIINERYLLYIDMGFYLRFITNKPNLRIVYTYKDNQGAIISDYSSKLKVDYNHNVYGGFSVSIFKYIKHLCIQLKISQCIRPTMIVDCKDTNNVEAVTFKILPTIVTLGMRYQFN